MPNDKKKTQRAILTLTDDETAPAGFKASIVFEPSMKGRESGSPSANAAVRLGLILKKNAAAFAADFPPAKPLIHLPNGNQNHAHANPIITDAV